MAVVNRLWITDLPKATFHPPALSTDVEADGATALPWVLLETQAYVADRRNATTACTVSRCGKTEVQVTLCVDAPPRVSYICVFCRATSAGRRGQEEERAEDMICTEPEIMDTEGDLVLLRVALGSREAMRYETYEHDLFVYRPGGREGPSLTLLERPPDGHAFRSDEVGLLSCPSSANHGEVGGHDGSSFSSSSYMVAALCQPKFRLERDLFDLYLYNSKHETWTMTTASVHEHQLQHHQQEGGYLFHLNTKVIALGGEDDTIAFVDLWRGILLCDLRHVQQNPRLRYIQLPEEPRIEEDRFDVNDARLSRDIAVVDGRIKCVRMGHQRIENSWVYVAASWSRTAATSLEEDAWQMDYDIEFANMDVSYTTQFELLPKPRGYRRMRGPVPPFKGLSLMQPTLGLQDGDATVCFMVNVNYDHGKALMVISVDMVKNKLQRVVQFHAKRYIPVGVAYMQKVAKNG
ncbi:hypothetical protein EJB05_19687, partial [Eragrostis curvula]